MGSWVNYVRIGAQLRTFEWISCLVLPPLAFLSDDGLHSFMLANGAWQLLLFTPVVFVPAALTGHLLYVDIGWPLGLVLLACNACRLLAGYWPRRALACGALLLHGGRMAVGALALFGQKSGFTYRFKEDLTRYQFAKLRWEAEAMPASHWPYKILHDAAQQCYANVCILPAPIVLMAANPSETLSALEVVGLGLWAAAWAFENAADTQKLAFDVETKQRGDRTAVLGYPPYDGPKYCLWRLCRHPNYFGEWLCWLGFTVAALPSLYSFLASGRLGLSQAALWAFVLWSVLRLFYDCLVHWTGAGPAEYYSVQRREKYKACQEVTRCFFPFELPFVNHFREAGWPRKP